MPVTFRAETDSVIFGDANRGELNAVFTLATFLNWRRVSIEKWFCESAGRQYPAYDGCGSTMYTANGLDAREKAANHQPFYEAAWY